MASKKKATKSKKSEIKGNGGFITDVSTFTRDTKRLTASGKPAFYAKYDDVTKATIGKSGNELYKAAADYLTKKTKKPVSWLAIKKRYENLGPGPQTMAIRALMRGGGKALLAGIPVKPKASRLKAKAAKAPAKKTTKKKAAPSKAPVARKQAKAAKAVKTPAKAKASKPRAPKAVTGKPAQVVHDEAFGPVETLSPSETVVTSLTE